MFPDRIIGKQINLVRGGRLFPFKITGIMKDIPDHSHLRLSVVISYSTLEKYNENFNQRWGNSLMTYLLLEEHADVERLEAKVPQFLDDIIPENSVWAGDKLDLYLQPLDEIHLESGHIKYQIQNYQKGDLSSIYIFGFVSLLVILVACFNYVNLSTARAFQRAEEVGIRKIFGSARSSLIAQFLVESIILAGVASLIGLLMAWYALPPFKDLMELQVPFYLFETEYLLPGIGLLILLVGLAAGSYPAFFLSSFEPVQTLKGKYYRTSSGAFLRKFLVTTQFAVVATLFIVSGYIWNQMEYVAEKNMGFNKEDVMYISLQTRDARTHIPLIKQQLSQVNGVRSISAASHYLPSGSGDMTLQVPSVDNPQSLLVRNSIVDPSYVETMGMELVVGRDFSEDIGADTVSSILVNETLVQRLGWEDPVGKQLQSGNGEDATLYTVIGVVNDFNYFSLRESIDPLIMRARPSGLSYLMIRIEDTEISNTVSELRSVFKELVPEQTFDYTFLDDRMATMYQSDRNYGKLIAAFAGLSIIIACMGLLGITAFVVEQKTKEIGIRKVLGSSRSQIMLLVTKPFLKLSGVALLIAVPAGYWLGNRWLDKFQYFDRPGVLIYLVSAFAIFLITYLTVSFHTYKASNLNPVDAIRSE